VAGLLRELGGLKCQLGEMAAGCQLLRESAGLYQWTAVPQRRAHAPAAAGDDGDDDDDDDDESEDHERQLTVDDVISVAQVCTGLSEKSKEVIYSMLEGA